MVDTHKKELKMKHDLLLSQKPSEASHDASLCPFCDASEDGAEHRNEYTPKGGDNPVENTITQSDLDAVKAEADAIRAELDALKNSADQAAVDAKFAEQEELHTVALAELQAELDKAVAEATANKQEHSDLVAFLEEEVAKAEAQAAQDARREDVKAQVAEHAPFADEYIESNLDRWASLDAEAFEAQLEDWKAIKAAKSDKKDVAEKVASSAMEHGSEESNTPSISDLRRSLRGTNLRSISL